MEEYHGSDRNGELLVKIRNSVLTKFRPRSPPLANELEQKLKQKSDEFTKAVNMVEMSNLARVSCSKQSILNLFCTGLGITVTLCLVT